MFFEPGLFRRPGVCTHSRLNRVLGLLLALATSGLLRVPTASSAAAASAAATAGLGIDRDGESVRLTLRGEDGREYSLEAVEALLNAGAQAPGGTGPAWGSVATIAPNDRPVVLYDPTCSVRPQNFYRLRLLQGSIPVEVPNFRLLDLDGRAHELFYQTDARAVVLVLAGSDLASLTPVAAELRRLQDSLGGRGVRLWVVADTDAAQRDRVKAQAEAVVPGLTVLEDEGGAVSRALGGSMVPEAIALDAARWSVVYRGRVADSVPAAAGPSTQALLGNALAEFLDGRRVVIRHAAPVGTPLGANPHAGGSYGRDIAPLLKKHCVPCHSPGNIAPWAMTNHTVVRDYAPLMKDEILTRRMPPWHADRGPQRYANEGMLAGDEIAMLADWIDRGAPRGDGVDPLERDVPSAPPEWPLGTPDRVVTIDPQFIPASGTVNYRYLVLPSPYPTDVWLRAAVVKPGNPRVVHHVLVFSATGIADLLQIQGGLGGYFAAYVPGMEQVAFPEGTGKLLKRGSYLVFQLHYTATGQPETDRTEVGLYLAPTPPARELRTAAAYDTTFTIPPGAPEFPATAEFRMPRDGVVYEMSPHMHYRGSWFRFDAVYADGRRETLLNVPFYRFDWQTLYRLAEPKRLPAGTRIVATGGWDNSPRNPYNPDPSATVRFGEQSWEEMFIGYFNWSDAP